MREFADRELDEICLLLEKLGKMKKIEDSIEDKMQWK